MRLFAAILSIATGLALAVPAHVFAQDLLSSLGGSLTKHHTQVKLLLSADTAAPGDTILAGVDMTMEPGWHTYWKNPGDAGSATKIAWTLPPGVSAGEIQWPLPHKLPPAEVTTYGYEDEVLLIVPLKLETNVAPGTLKLSAKVSWLECKDVCIPANATVEAKVDAASETKISADAAIIDLWKSKTPKTDDAYSFQAAWEKPASDDSRPLLISHGLNDDAAKNIKYDSVDFFPGTNDAFEVQAATEVIAKMSGDIRLRKIVKKLSGDWPKEISGTMVIESGVLRYGYDVKLPVTEMSAAPGNLAQTTAAPNASSALPAQSLGLMLLYAFIGGLILNIMPCVLPVIALKILGFVREAKSEPRHVRTLGLVYTLGVLVSFLALAGIIIGVKAAGHQAGWGMQFGSPVFVVCLTTLVLLVALNLFGVFEVTVGGRALDAAGELTAKGGPAGAFFNGVLATTLATPCTAPFLVSALGFAFAQSTLVIVLIFLAAGLGLASPYLVLSCQPGWLTFLPKPGAWMEKFKNAMAFPMLATMVWLFNVAASSYGAKVLWLGMFLVAIAFAAWIYGEFVQRGRAHRMFAALVTVLIIAGGYACALEEGLDWRAPIIESSAAGSLRGAGDAIDWQRWSPAAVAEARSAGKPLLVDFTASWCVTCNAIIKPALDDPSVADKLKAMNGVALLADYTRSPVEMTDEIAKYGAGVPLVLVYPKDATAPPIVLPQPSPLQLPSSYRKIVLEALARAAE